MQIRQIKNVRRFQSVVAIPCGGGLSSSAGDAAAPLAELRETLEKIGRLAIKQHDATDLLRRTGILAREQRPRLNAHHQRPIVGVARTVLPEAQRDVPAFAKPLKHLSLASVIGRAQAMADASRPQADAFVRAGLRVDELTAAAPDRGRAAGRQPISYILYSYIMK